MEKVRMTVRLVPKLNQDVQKIAKKCGKSKNSIIIDACWDFVEKIKKENKFNIESEE
ncbi:hypothetical protein ACTPDT_05050 [Clostridioides difficile]|jgi:predicted transcriptional regulator|uniref:Arc family DNA-binding protein n=1 Tax=Clostridioides difficile TaxID=1496 RepID=A0AB74QF48_CLODI|nr:hypothetical protein [Clostridioides difficile]DAL33964.1 MAG TPA_asm: antitoxin [Caudoviricetes sp.]AXU64253.1 hypothetical protein CDIF28669_01607 [Clostridioides difficile]AXU75285.1 hypothetical protein CDIF28670_01689 [Clostridioides difficile]EJX3384336.1 hypothetical protein [Clostridioides difficile]EKG0766162.1 hypothetical protein [Clostridioides difficile]